MISSRKRPCQHAAAICTIEALRLANEILFKGRELEKVAPHGCSAMPFEDSEHGPVGTALAANRWLDLALLSQLDMRLICMCYTSRWWSYCMRCFRAIARDSPRESRYVHLTGKDPVFMYLLEVCLRILPRTLIAMRSLA